MERLSDFLLHLDVILRAIPVDIFQGVPNDFPIQLDSSIADLDLDAVSTTFATSAKELDCYVASLAETEATKLQKLQKKTQEAEIQLRQVNKILEDVMLELKQAEAILTKTLENNSIFEEPELASP